MRIKFSKRVLALFCSVVIIATSMPVAAVTAQAADTNNYAKFTDGYIAEYADPSTNAITKVVDPIYRNSFDDASLSDFGVTSNAGVASAGERTKTLHLTAHNSAPGNYATFSTNPLVGKDLKSTGATIMGWNRYTLDKSDVDYVPMFTFYGVPSSSLLSAYGLSTDSTNNDDDYWYVAFTLGGYILISKGAIDGNGSYNNYVDYMIDATKDIVGIPYTSTTVTTKNTDVWTHYAFTINQGAIKFYCGGVEYTFSTSLGSGYDSSLAENFNYLLDFITDSNVKLSIGYGLKYWHNDADTYYDDLRVYDTCLTQQQIRAVYGEGDDCVYKYAEGHDPTIVYNETKKSGEFNYYMFGTGLTIYGSNDLANWYELADDQGRTGYQSTKLFGGDYKTVLGSSGTNKAQGRMPLHYSANTGSGSTNNSTGTGAGLMVWAPSVFYNTTTNTWQMFAATSSWGSSCSCIFVAESDTGVEGPYDEIYTIIYSGFKDAAASGGVVNVTNYNSNYRSSYLTGNSFSGYKYDDSNWPNCIDPAPFYDANGNLYMSYGSWSGGIWMVKLTDDGHAMDNAGLTDPYYGTKIAATSQESDVTSVSGSAEGSFVYYDPETNYYYLTVVYGAVHQYRYTMRVWRSSSVTGPYTDATSTSALTASTNDKRSGMKLMGNYNFSGTGTQYYDNGHSSNLIVPSSSGTNEAGKQFISYHTRMYDGYRTERSLASTNYLNEARVHQVVMSQDGWQCILPYQYSGETFGNDGFAYSIPNLAGTWSFILHSENIQATFQTTQAIKLNKDGTVAGNYNGTWELVMDGTKPYLNMVINMNGTNATFKGVFVTMIDELGAKRTVLSAVGETEGYKTIAWGAKQDALKPASSMPDSELSMIASDGYDNIIYTHGSNKSTSYGSGSSSDYMFFGDEISDGTVPPSSNATYRYSAKDGSSVANNPGYEQGERATYIYIADKYSISENTEAITDTVGNKMTATKITSDKTGYNKYLLTGSISGAGAKFGGLSDDTQRFYNTTVVVPYTDATGAEYSQHIYATVMPNPVSANAMSASIKYSEYYSEANALLRVDGSTGSVTPGTYIGNYAYLDNPVYVGGLCGYAFGWNDNQSTYLVTGGSSNNATGVNKAGAYATGTTKSTTGSGRQLTVSSTASGTVSAKYYLDLSKLDGTSEQKLGGLTVNPSTNILNFNLLSSELPGYNSSGISKRTQKYTLSNGAVFSWGNHVSHYNTGGNTVVNTSSIAAGTEMMYGTSTISANYSSYVSSAASANQKLTDTATFECQQYVNKNVIETANSIIDVEVNIFDKSAVYDELDQYKSLVQTDYTTETWEELEAAVSEATWYCNNYKIFDKDTAGSTVSPQSYCEELVKNMTEAEQALFSYEEFTDFREIYDLAVAVAANASSGTLANPDALTTLQNAISVYAAYSVNTDGENITSSNWESIKDKNNAGIADGSSANYNNGVTAPGSIAKFNYNKAYVELAKAMSEVKSLTDYSDLETSLYGQSGIYDGSTYTENSATGLVKANTDSSENLKAYDDGQQYTLDTWLKFDSAYDTAKARSLKAGTASSIENYRKGEYKYTNMQKTVTEYGTYDPSGKLVETYNPDGTLIKTDYTYDIQSTDLSNEQLSINQAYNELTAARAALKTVDNQSYYDTYNAAQQFAALADFDAYNVDGQNAINYNFSFGYVKADGTVYATDYNPNAANPAAYTIYNSTVYKNAPSGYLDTYSAGVLNTVNTTSNLNKYNVTYNVYVDGIQVQSNSSSPDQYYFGENIQFNVPSTYATSDYIISKWTVQADDTIVPTILKDTDTSVNRKIQKDTTVEVYLSSVNSAKTKVIVVDYFGVQLDAGYADVDASGLPTDYVGDASKTLSYTGVDKDGNTVNHSVSVNESPYYTFTGWSIKKTEENVITVTQLGTRALPSGSYEVLDSTGTVNGVSILNPVDLNTVLTFNSEISNFYAWVMSSDKNTWYVASYDSTFETLSRDCKTLYYKAITADQISECFPDSFEAKDVETYKTPYSFGCATTKVTLNGNDKFRVYCTFTSNADNENIKVVQAGVLAARGETVPSDFTKGATGVTTVAVNAISDYNTYTATTSVPSSGNVYVRSFVSYIYTDASGNSIPRVAYGPVVSCDSTGKITY